MRANPTSAGERRRPPAWGPARSRVVTWHDPSVILAASRGCSGLDTLRAIRDGDLPSPPVLRLLQMDLVDLEEGRVEVRCAVIRPGRRVALAEGPVRDTDGQIVATASSSLVLFTLPSGPEAPTAGPDATSREDSR
jgi:hypothetical protein